MLFTLALSIFLQAAEPPATRPITADPPQSLSTRLLAAKVEEGDRLINEAISLRLTDDAVLFDSLATALDPAQRPVVRRILTTAVPVRPFSALPEPLATRVAVALISNDLSESVAAEEIVRATWPACRDRLLELVRIRDDWPRFAVLYADIEPIATDPAGRLMATIRPRVASANSVDPLVHWAVGDAVPARDEHARRLCELFKTKATLEQSGRRWHTSHGLAFLLDVKRGTNDITLTLHIANVSDQSISLARSTFMFGLGRGSWAIRDRLGTRAEWQRKPGVRVNPARGDFPVTPGERITRDLVVFATANQDGSHTLSDHLYRVEIPTWPAVASWYMDPTVHRYTDWPGAVYLSVTLP